MQETEAQIQEGQVTPPLQALAAAIKASRLPTESNLASLRLSLQNLASSSSRSDVVYFAGDALSAVGRPDIASEILLQIEPDHLLDLEFYIKLFAAAEANRNAELMRRAAARRYELAPNNLLTVLHYAAILILFDEQHEKAVELSARCVDALPRLVPVRINHAAALINADLFGPADLILKQIDEASLSPADRNRLRLIQLKRAVKIQDRDAISKLKPLIDQSQLYSHELAWFKRNTIPTIR